MSPENAERAQKKFVCNNGHLYGKKGNQVKLGGRLQKSTDPCRSSLLGPRELDIGRPNILGSWVIDTGSIDQCGEPVHRIRQSGQYGPI